MHFLRQSLNQCLILSFYWPVPRIMWRFSQLYINDLLFLLIWTLKYLTNFWYCLTCMVVRMRNVSHRWMYLNIGTQVMMLFSEIMELLGWSLAGSRASFGVGFVSYSLAPLPVLTLLSVCTLRCDPIVSCSCCHVILTIMTM